MSTKSPKANRKKHRPSQVIYRVGETAISMGMPIERLGAFFAQEPGAERGVMNDFMADLASGEYSRLREIADLKWLPPGKTPVIAPSSQRARAQSLSAGHRWLDRNGLDLTTVTERDIQRLGHDMSKGRKPGTVAEIQTSVLIAAQWCVWKGLRPPFHVSTRKFSVNYGGANMAEGYRASVVLTVPPRRTGYITPEQQAAICAAVPDEAKRIAIEMLFLGLRVSEPETVIEHNLISSSQATAAGPNYFAVTGKGNKPRSPEIDLERLRRIDNYRLIERPARVATFKRLNGTDDEPAALLLNAKNGNALSKTMIYRAFKKAALGLGITATPHWARHAFAVDFIADGVVSQLEFAKQNGLEVRLGDLDRFMDDLRVELMGLLGHSRFETSRIYLGNARRSYIARLSAPRLQSLGVS